MHIVKEAHIAEKDLLKFHVKIKFVQYMLYVFNKIHKNMNFIKQ